MAKYVCDFEQVTAVGEKLIQAGDEMKSAISTYSSNIESDLSSWTGDAKSSFTSSNATCVEQANADIDYIIKLGEFIKSASQAIETLDNDLASLTI